MTTKLFEVVLFDPADPDNPDGTEILVWYCTWSIIRARECQQRLEASGLAPFIVAQPGEP